MSLARFYCKRLMEPSVEIAGSEAQHMKKSMRLSVGDEIELFDGAGGLARGVIQEVGSRKLVVGISGIERHIGRNKGRIIMAASIAKADRFNWLIGKCTELGVDEIWPVVYERTVKQAKNPKVVERYMGVAISAAKQCGRLFLPRIEGPGKLNDVLAKIKERFEGAVLLTGSLNDEADWLIEKIPRGGDIVVFIGPEGGLTEGEEELLRACGSVGVRLTATTLRIETAAVAFGAILVSSRDACSSMDQ